MWAHLQELIFPLPPVCLWCGRHGTPALCGACRRELVARQVERCPRCLRPIARQPALRLRGRTRWPGRGAAGDQPNPRCWSCRVRPPAFRGVTCLGPYRGLLRWTVNAVKECGQRFLLPPLADLLFQRLLEDGAQFDQVSAPPPDPRRLRRRGFHPALVLADRIAARAGRPYEPGLLRRIRPARPQSGLTGSDRRRNLRGVMAVVPGAEERLRGRRVLLVDDVLTTGSTLDAAARALLAAGATSVWAAVVADNGSRRALP